MSSGGGLFMFCLRWGELRDRALASGGKKQMNKEAIMKAGKNRVTFKSFGVDLVGDLYLPEGFDENKKYTAIVGASAFPQVKEQVLGTYGPEMAARGFVFLGFDYLGMGDSPALPGEHKQSRYMFSSSKTHGMRFLTWAHFHSLMRFMGLVCVRVVLLWHQ